MDYPDPDEEYELMHADEIELMNELEEEDFDFPRNIVSKQTPKRQLNFSNCPSPPCEAKKPVKINEPPDDDYPSDDDLPKLQQVPSPPSRESKISRNCDSKTRSLSDGPFPTTSRNGSTPSTSTNGLEPSTFSNEPGNNDEDVVLVSNKRTVSDLFGDITDLELELSSQTKRQKLEEEHAEKEARQDLMIRTIVEQRRKLNEEKSSFRLGREQKVKKLEDCICYGSVPKWPFIPACVKGERVYIRLHTEEKVQKDLKNVECNSRNTGLLGIPYKELHNLAISEVSKKIDKLESKKHAVAEPSAGSKDLWVEKYKPKIYLQLLSDEATNRSLLYWLKLWDKVVFNKEPKVLKHGFPGTERRELLDEHGRPVQKVALLCGPPGLGKTTLAHMIAKQAGYTPIEVNASDDRSPQAFRTHLESATQMKSVMSSNPNPNCLILDEIDGAPQAAVDVLIKYITDKSDSKSKKKKGRGILKRPIICICNDIYVPALRSLRQIAYTIVFPPTSSSRLGERLMEISKMEDLITDLGTMMVLSEKSNNDIRSCLSILQYLKAKGTRITLGQVQSSSVGAKDMQQGLFTVWESVFQIKLSKKGQGASSASKVNNQKTSLSGPLSQVLQTVQSYGDYERLTNGVFENYAKVRPTDSPIAPVVKALNWFVFQDLISSHIKTSQNYSLYGYLPWAFVQWHILFASIQKPKLAYPSTVYDVASRIQRNRQVLDFLFSGMSPKLQSYQHRGNLLLDIAPMLVVLVTPNVRPVSIQLYTQKEKNELSRVVSVMADYNVNYSQMRTPEGHYNFLLDPNIEELVCFSENPRENITTYTVRQLLSKEVECEKIRRSAAKPSSHNDDSNESKSTTSAELPTKDKAKTPGAVPTELPTKDKAKTPTALPNHLQKLTPKAIKKKVVEVQAKDFFGRIVEKSLASEKSKAKTDEIVKSDIWFHFKEGYNNAVRKNVYLSDLL